MKKILPFVAALALMLTACSGPSPDDLRKEDPEGHTACMHFGGALDTAQIAGQTNMDKSATHGAAASTAEIREAVTTDEAGNASIPDLDVFQKACEAQGFDYN